MSTINYHIDPKIRMKQMVYHAQRTAKEFESTGDYQKAKLKAAGHGWEDCTKTFAIPTTIADHHLPGDLKNAVA